MSQSFLDVVQQKRVLILLVAGLLLSLWVGWNVDPTWSVDETALDVHSEDEKGVYFIQKGRKSYLDEVVVYESAQLNPVRLETGTRPAISEEFVMRGDGADRSYARLDLRYHFQYWSLLPAIMAIILCWVTKEPITSLLAGIVSGAFLLGRFDITGDVLIGYLSTTSAATVLVLYLWFLGGLLGVWSKTGAAQAFAEYMAHKFVRGPRSAKLVAWALGIVFFQGGTVSTVLVGTTVKPLADDNKVSHEELSYIVDSTASPIASQLAFNAWPGYVQAFIYVAGVGFLATEADRVIFFFKSVPFCFYAIFAVLGTFLLSIEKPIFLGKRMTAAIERSRSTGQLDSTEANPLAAKEIQTPDVPATYRPHLLDFVLPLVALIGVAIGTFVAFGSPNVLWAFGVALLLASFMALGRGLSLNDLVDGVTDGMKGVVGGSVILLLAITIGGVSKEAGGGTYLVDILSDSIPFWFLPVMLQILTIIIAFSTGTSWGTYAVAFPLAMPLAWAVAGANGLAHPEFFMTICFAAVMDGSVYGDQCSPISDTTVLSSISTGCDLMDHVKTQIPQASFAAGLAAICWTIAAALSA
ncbi:MAG: sodium:proton antiporter [Gemmatimonadetes bacterium]|jgi:Na+/H+ antiporter NhaC|nr:sodium:proton antiporter [Gemmatimonadota bacterium]HCK10016.1 sodium:proton antiporter [Candidatus Latescibacterota bacterium]